MTLEEAKKILENEKWTFCDSNVYGPSSNYANFYFGLGFATIDGDFSADELEALAIVMRASQNGGKE